MATFDYLRLCQTVRREVNVSGSGPSAVTSQTGQLGEIVEMVWQSTLYVESLWEDWKFLWTEYSSTIATSSQTPLVTKPTDFGFWHRNAFWLDYSGANPIKLDFLEWDEYRDNFGFGSLSNAQPGRVVIKPDNTIQVEVPADQSYTISGEYWKTPTVLAANTDEPGIPTRFRRVIVARAKIMWADVHAKPHLLDLGTAEYEDMLTRLEGDQLPGRENARQSRARDPVVVVPQ